MSGPSEQPSWLEPSPTSPLTGSEPFRGIEATVADFWRWAFGDLRDNTSRGVLAEFLVARAVGDTHNVRVGWAPFDVEAPDGTRIEVKASAYLQGWAQRQLSRLAFGRLKGLEFYPDTNEYSEDARVRADVFVFAVQTQTDPNAYDALDIDHWRFWVVRSDDVRDKAGKSVGISWSRSMPPSGIFALSNWRPPLRRRGRPDDLCWSVRRASGSSRLNVRDRDGGAWPGVFVRRGEKGGGRRGRSRAAQYFGNC